MIRRDYTTYRIIPDCNVKNHDNQTITQSICSTFIPPIERLTRRGIYEKTRFYFDIELTKGGADFFITLPNHVEELILSKTRTTWNKANIHEEQLKILILIIWNLVSWC